MNFACFISYTSCSLKVDASRVMANKWIFCIDLRKYTHYFPFHKGEVRSLRNR